jgi:hypothetical protein
MGLAGRLTLLDVLNMYTLGPECMHDGSEE